jgi:hypothetical protein
MANISNAGKSMTFQVGDFVMFHEGMGECGHGTIIGIEDNTYRVRAFHYGMPRLAYERFVGYLYPNAKTTEKEAMEYFFLRSGGLRIKLWLHKP